MQGGEPLNGAQKYLKSYHPAASGLMSFGSFGVGTPAAERVGPNGASSALNVS